MVELTINQGFNPGEERSFLRYAIAFQQQAATCAPTLMIKKLTGYPR